MRIFTALYTHQKQKKAKTWQEGTARYNNESNELLLFDSSSQRMASYRLRAKDEIELSKEYDIGRFLLTLEEEQGQAGDDSTVVKGREAPSATSLLASGARDSRLGALKRAKKLPSLIKPIKIKSNTAAEAAATTAAASSADLPGPGTKSELPLESKSDAMEYSVFHTTQKVKKVKAWAEGTLMLYPSDHRIVLKSEDGSTLTSTRLPKSKALEVGGELDVGHYLVQIECIRGQEDSSKLDCASPGPQLQGALKRRNDATAGSAVASAKTPRLEVARKGLQRVKLQKRVSDTHLPDTPAIAVELPSVAPAEGALAASALQMPSKPAFFRAHSSDLKLHKTPSSVSASSAIMVTRAPFAPPTSQTPTYLHFPRRGELLQHVSVSKGYGLGPSRQLTAPTVFAECKDYQKTFSALLRENLMAELSALAIRYFFMARERFEGSQGHQERGSSSKTAASRRGGRRFGTSSSLSQVCKSVGVLFFDECTIRQPFMDGAAFKAQVDSGQVGFKRGDSITLELSRRENYAGYAKDDTWAISACGDFKTESTVLARSVFYGPTKNNTLELMLVGDEDAKVAAKLFNSECNVSNKGGRRRGDASFERKTPSVVAIRCLDSASDWSMIDTLEAQLSAETMPLLPHLLQANATLPPLLPLIGIDTGAILARIGKIIRDKRLGLSINDEQFGILERVVMSAVSIYLPVDEPQAVTIVHGPFGTGKSFLVSAIVICLDAIADEFPEVFGSACSGSSLSDDSLSRDSPTTDILGQQAPSTKQRMRVLVSSMTNFAVDNMLSALLKQGYDQFLRVGNLKRISKQILPYVCRSASGASDDIRYLEAMLEESLNETEQDAIHTAIQRLRRQRVQDALESAFVVGTTCLSAGTAVLRSESFPVVILDEACQIVEPMALIALANAGCQRLVLVGDPLQLPPTLTTRAAKAAEGKGLDRALFDRLMQMGHRPQFLSTQYRCHPRIGSLCNQLFYEGRLCHGIAPSDRQPLIPTIPPLAFLETPGQEKQHGKSQSFFNKGEIDMAVQLVRRMLQGGIDAASIGVIALYKTQADMIREQLGSILGQRCRVQVSTVDAYQGSEREIIIISCVRTEKIGFIANPNRVNVALSRARRHCFILGARKILETNSMWRRILEYCRAGDGSGGGVVSAQSFINRLANAAASHMHEDGYEDGSMSPLAMSSDVGPSADVARSESMASIGGIQRNGILPDAESEDGRAVSDAGKSDFAEPASESAHDPTLGEDDDVESTSAECEYDEEGVVGGSLSQWSIAGIPTDSEDDGDEDALDCLDVDADDM